MSVSCDRRGRVFVVAINRPERRNAIDGAAAQALDDALDLFAADEDLWVLVLTGTPEVFSSGADLKARVAGEKVMNSNGFAGVTHRSRDKPMIAAVEGAAVGGGFEMVLACDLVVASTTAFFGLPEVRHSVIAAAGGTYRAGWALPRNVANQMLLTGEPLTAQRAYDLGFVSTLTAPGEALSAACAVAETIVANGPLAVRAALRIAGSAHGLTDAQAQELTTAEYSALRRTDDYREGPRAFVEHRPPRWTAR